MKKRKILWLAISIIMILALTLVSACTSKAPTTTLSQTTTLTPTKTLTPTPTTTLSPTSTTKPDATVPMVTGTINTNGATNVPINTKVSIYFTEAMDPLTLTTTTFTLKQGATPVAGTVTYTGVTATFTPAANLAPNTEYTATITTGAKDLAGNAMANPYTWKWITGAALDATAPMISSAIPFNTQEGVPINTKVDAFFSEAMDPLTITAITFTLTQGTTPVAGTVTYTGVTATFTPSSNLAPVTIYTATITTGSKDLAGIALASNEVWSFKTGAAPDTTAPTVSSTIPANIATGVAVNSAMAITFSEAMDPLTLTTATFTLKQGTTPVSGTVTYIGTTATFTPDVDLTPNLIYTVTITTGAKDLAGNALASNFVWTFTSAGGGGGGGGGGTIADTTPPTVSSIVPVNAAIGVGVNTAMTATFSEAMDPLTLTTVTFTLMKGTTPVSGAVFYAYLTATFVPDDDLAAGAIYTATITTGAKDLAGNALASNFVWTFTAGVAPDTTPPTVSSTIPASAATGVAVNSAMTATFSEAIDPLTLTTVTFTLKQGTTPVTGTVTYAGVTATFTPAVNLAISTNYTATITTVVTDLAGNPLAVNKVWSFTTGAASDTTAPTVSSTIPANAATGVAVNSAMTATFSEAMDPLTVTTVSFTLKQGTTPVTGAVTYIGVTATFTPAVNLAVSTNYTATITTGVTDLAGNPLAVNKVWSFTTGTSPDTTAPTVISTIPDNAATRAAVNGVMSATFSEALNPLTVTTATFTLKQGTTPVAGWVTYAGVTATFAPISSLAFSTNYTATITTVVTDLAGNPLAVNKVWTFTTSAPPLAAVNLGSAGNFAILAKTGISTTGTTSIVGDIGVSPAAATYITGFGLIMDASNLFSTSSLVTGKVYAPGYAAPTPTYMTTAVSDMQIAYTDAAGRTLPDATELGAGNIGGMTLAPGLYKWGSGVTIPTDVTLSGGANDVWIFQIAQTLTVSSGVHINLSGGAQAKNIFWQVAGQTTLGTTCVFNGNILCQTAIVLNNGATLNGRALAQTAVTLIANAVIKPTS